MKRFVLGFLAVSLLAVGAYAGKQQLASTYYRLIGGTNPFYGRTDGIVVGTRAKEMKVVNNGEFVSDIGKSLYEDFTSYSDGEDLSCTDSYAKGACAGNTTLVPCTCTTTNGFKFAWVPLVTATLGPDMDAGSLDISGDQTDNDGSMIVFGGPHNSSGAPFVIGRDPAFHFCTEAAVADATGIDGNIMAGFVELADEAWNADFEALNSYAGIGILGTAAAGVTAEDVTIKTEDDGGGVTTTDTTDDATEAVKYKYCVYVSATGAVTYTFNGSAPTATAAFSFDDGIMVVPFMTYLHTADLAGEIDLYTVEVAYDE